MKRLTEKPNIAVVTQPMGKGSPGGIAILSNYFSLIKGSVGQIYLITDNCPEFNDEVHVINIETPELKWKALPSRMVRMLLVQLKVCKQLLKVNRKVQVIIFYLGSDLYVLPMMMSRLLGKKVIRFVVGRHSHFSRVEFGHSGSFLTPLLKIIENLSFMLANRINVLSPRAVQAMKLEKYRHKVTISGAQYIDDNVFTITEPFNERVKAGHIGGLGPRKGAYNLAQAIPLVLEKRSDIRFIIKGPGSPEETAKIEAELIQNGARSQVELGGWVPTDQFSARLNELKLFILASYEEGLPAVVQQAMACGAVPIATAVGGIPDLIKDGETGFLLKDNTPAFIAEAILKALDHPNLAGISENARKFIQQEYGHKKLAAGCLKVFESLRK